MNSVFCELLQHDPATQPICPHVGGRFVQFPDNLDEFPMGVVAELDEYKLATTIKNGEKRFGSSCRWTMSVWSASGSRGH